LDKSLSISSERCLSDWRIAQLVRGEALRDASARAHLGHCESCQRLLMEQRDLQHAINLAPVPPEILRAAQSMATHRRRQRWQLAGAFAAACAASLLWVTARPPAPEAAEATERLKGGDVSLVLTVQRDHTVVASDHPVEAGIDLRAGDELTVRLAGVTHGWVALQGIEEAGWVTYYEGAVPDGGRLPAVLGITDDSPTRLRVVRCDEAPADPLGDELPRGCDTHLFSL
jgi:hypothetical protein